MLQHELQQPARTAVNFFSDVNSTTAVLQVDISGKDHQPGADAVLSQRCFELAWPL